ncbi:heavy metal translocating P-type ATPase [Persicobacter diffluens]|uniref:P-type Cu(+) transporter n=1 Tax=Persicobacter diffluens TaxID=981 RepID=A0AAN5ALC5_9BACT|nr:copper-translocating P-type ATPase [Persicobacter diffluens]
MTQKTIKIGGMSCANCAANIEKTLQATHGIEEASVNFAMETAQVDFDENKLDEKSLQQVIEKQGFRIIPEERHIAAQIEGMTCGSCVANVEKAIAAVEGVQEVEVNLLTQQAKIALSPQVKIKTIEKAVKAAGFKMNTESKELEHISYYHRFLGAALFTIPLLIISMGEMLGLPLPKSISAMHHPLANGIIQMALTTGALYFGRQFFISGFQKLFHLKPNMDSLVALGAGASFLVSIFALIFTASGELPSLYFESAAVIVSLILMGKWLEEKSKKAASSAISALQQLRPQAAMRWENGQWKKVNIQSLEKGDLLLIRQGEKIPADGNIINGQVEVDESMLTGESKTIFKEVGANLIGGTLCVDGHAEFEISQVGENSRLAQIIRLVQEAQGQKAPVAKLADQIAGVFVPIVIILATLAALAWWIAGSYFGYNLPEAPATFAFQIGVAILVIACPCALGLATPTAIMVATGRAAYWGILYKGGEALQKGAEIDFLLLDKTGTLTEGKPQVRQVKIAPNFPPNHFWGLIYALEQNSIHPIAQALITKAGELAIEPLPVQHFQNKIGRGLSGEWNNQKVLLGSKAMMLEAGISMPALPETAGTLIFLAVDGKLAGHLLLEDAIRPEAKKAVLALQQMNIQTAMASGDQNEVVKAISQQLNISTFKGQLSPEGKADWIKALQASGKKVAMVGDGINDAPALAQADLGISLAEASESATHTADVLLMKNDLSHLLATFKMSRASLSNIKMNLFWAFAYNVVSLPFAAGIFYLWGGPLLNPMIAAAAMSMSSVSVVLNALRLNYIKMSRVSNQNY